MIAPRNDESALRILAIGLHDSEYKFLKQTVEQVGGVLIPVKTDMELWDRARIGHWDMYILAQSPESASLSYLIWLLKGIAHQSAIVLIYSSLSSDEAERLKQSPACHTLQRPLDAQRLTHALDNALNAKADRRSRFWPRVHDFFHTRFGQRVPHS